MTASMNTYNTRNANNIPLLKVKDNFFENSFFFLLQLSNGTRPKKNSTSSRKVYVHVSFLNIMGNSDRSILRKNDFYGDNYLNNINNSFIWNPTRDSLIATERSDVPLF